MLHKVYPCKTGTIEFRINVMQMMIFATGVSIASQDNMHGRIFIQ